MITKSTLTARARAILLPAAAWMAALAAALCQSQIREFSSPDGKKLKAEILGVSGETVKLKLENGREITTAKSAFSKADQDYISTWQTTNQPRIRYGFEVGYHRTRTGKSKSQESNVSVTNEKWAYEIEVENESSADLTGLEVQYKIYKSANADSMAAYSSMRNMTREGDYFVLKGKATLGDLQRLKSATVTTESIPISKSELDPNYYYVNGGKNKKRDEIDGAWFKIFHNGKEVHEVKSSHAALKNAKW